MGEFKRCRRNRNVAGIALFLVSVDVLDILADLAVLVLVIFCVVDVLVIVAIADV